MRSFGASFLVTPRASLALKELTSDPLFRRLMKNSGLLLGGSGLATALGLASSVLKARALGPELFGLLAVVTAFAGTVTLLTTISPSQAVIKFGAIGLGEDKPDRFISTVKIGLLLDLISTGLGTLVCLLGAYLLMPHLGWSTNAVELGAVSTLLVLTSALGTPIGVLRLLDRFRPLAVQQVLTGGLGFGGAVAVYILRGGIWGFLWVQIGSQLLGTTFLAWCAWREMTRRGFPSILRTRIMEWRPMVRFSSWIFVLSSTGIPTKQLDVLIVGSVISIEAAGIYKVIKQFLMAFVMLTNPIYDASYPQFANLIGGKDEEGAIRYAVRLGVVILAVAAPVAFVLAATSHLWLPVAFGLGYSQASAPLAVFLGFAVVGVATNPVHPLSLAFGFARMSTIVSMVTAAIYLVLAFILGKQFGLVGMGLAYGAQMCVGPGLKTAYIRRRGHLPTVRSRGGKE